MNSNAPEPQNQPGLTLDTVLVVPSRLTVDRKTLKPEEQLLLALADGRGPVSEILRLSGMPGTATMRMLRSLCERGCLEAVGRSGGPSTQLLTSAPAPEAPAPAPARARLTQDLTDFIGRLSEARAEAAKAQAAAAAQADTVAEAAPAAAAEASSNETLSGAGPPLGEDPFAEQRKAAAEPTRSTLVGLDPVPPRRAVARTALYDTTKMAKEAAKLAAAKSGPKPSPVATRHTTMIDTLARGAAAAGVIAAGRATSGVIERSETGPDPELDKPTRIGAYEVVARMAQGGVGSIYLCRREGARSFQRLYALKVIRQHSVEAELAAKSFLREARVGSLLSHPNVLPVVDLGHYQDQPFLLMDYVEGTSLGELLQDGIQYPPKLVLPVMLDVLRGLARAHDLCDEEGRRLGLVHGDVSPQNILVGTDGAARITDFGSVRFTALEDKDGEGLTMAKPAWSAPEQLKGEPVDPRTDLFAAGIVLWTALTGRKLFHEASYEQTVVNVLRRPILPPSSFGAPRALDDLCAKALARTPSERFQSAEEMAQALAAIAVAEGALPGVRAVGEWVRQSIGDVLKERKQRLKDIATGVTAPVIVSADGFEEEEAAEPRPRKPAPAQTVVLQTARPAPPAQPVEPSYDSDDFLVPARKRPLVVRIFDWLRGADD